MKKILYGILATVSGLVLLLSYRTSLGGGVSSTAADLSPAGETGQTAAPAPSSGLSAGSARPSAPSPTPEATSAATGWNDGTYTGAAVTTRYGAVQVSVTVGGGRITAVDVPEYPEGNARDTQINQRAIPQLVSETLSTQSARIDLVSGATYTSEGYERSLQSALDEAAR